MEGSDYCRNAFANKSNNTYTSSQSQSASEDDDKDDYKRKSRNASEKKRRDQFNILISELCAMVSTKSRKMDKSSVLKATISFLRQHNEITVRSSKSGIAEGWKPSFLSDDEFSTLMLEALDGFMLVISQQGHMLYASDSITTLLGHLPNEYQNSTIYELVHEDDRPEMYKILALADRTLVDCGTDILSKRFQFKCHMVRSSGNPCENPVYEPVQINGSFTRRVDEAFDVDSLASGSPYVFACTVRLQHAQLGTEFAVVSYFGNEFISRHSLDWKFLFLDHRGPPIIGYLPFEVLGTSGYDYYHQDDLEKLAKCHEAWTSCYHRFLTKGQEWIWLQTRYYISYNQWNSKPEFIVCNHKVVSYADVRAEMQRELGILSDKEIQMSDDMTASDSFRQEESSSECVSSPPVVSSTDSEKNRATPAISTSAEMPQSRNKGDWRVVTGYSQSECEDMSGSSGREEEPSSKSHVQSLFMPSMAISHQHSVNLPSSQQIAQMEVSSADDKSMLSDPGRHIPPDHLTAIQFKLQEQLVMKHQKLQEMILKQQEELHQVQSQLLMARQMMAQHNPMLMQQFAQQQNNVQQQQQQLQSQQQFLTQAGQHSQLQHQNPMFPLMSTSLGMSGFPMGGLMMLPQQSPNQLQSASALGGNMPGMAVPGAGQVTFAAPPYPIQMPGQQMNQQQDNIMQNPAQQMQFQQSLMQPQQQQYHLQQESPQPSPQHNSDS
ncbi:circadian locomoter output cycles protein kaput-like [Ptychodera flava]|uniref:circadian locomoter output cycles protein kaput-like n=1 Tax=Ptychodera flava TaxID=63121 RepID=UPI003969E7D0